MRTAPGSYLDIGILLSKILVSQDLGNGFDLSPYEERTGQINDQLTQQPGLATCIWCQPQQSTPENRTGSTATDRGSREASSEDAGMGTSAPTLSWAPQPSAQLCGATHPPVCQDPSTCGRQLCVPRVPAQRGHAQPLPSGMFPWDLLSLRQGDPKALPQTATLDSS